MLSKQILVNVWIEVHSKNDTEKNGTNEKLLKMAHLLKSTFKRIF